MILNNLIKICSFTLCGLPGAIEYGTLSLVKHDKIKSITPVRGRLTKIAVNQHTRIKNYKSIRTWWQEVFGESYNENIKFLKNGNFIVTRDEIHKHPIQYYSNLLRNIKHSPEVEEFMLSRAFFEILK